MTYCLALDDPNNTWNYCPNYAASIIFIVLYGITFIAHLYQAILYRKKFCWVVVVGSAWFLAAYILHTLNVVYPASQALATPQYILILTGPLWINAFIYMLFGRMVWFWLPDKKVFNIRAQRMGLVFVLLDITCFIIQLAGGFMTVGSTSSSTNSMLAIGLHIYTAGVAVQAFVILCFISLVISFQRRVQSETPLSRSTDALGLLRIVYVVLALIMFRNIYRIIEFSAGANSPITSALETHEVYPYVFDSVPMWIALLLLNIHHPGKDLVGADSDFPTRQQKKAEKAKMREIKKEEKEMRAQMKIQAKMGGNSEGSSWWKFGGRENRDDMVHSSAIVRDTDTSYDGAQMV